jgi:hypothetical protein
MCPSAIQQGDHMVTYDFIGVHQQAPNDFRAESGEKTEQIWEFQYNCIIALFASTAHKIGDYVPADWSTLFIGAHRFYAL